MIVLQNECLKFLCKNLTPDFTIKKKKTDLDLIFAVISFQITSGILSEER